MTHSDFPADQLDLDTQKQCVGGDQTCDPGRGRYDTRSATAGVAVIADPTLALLAEVLDDLERTRIANENRLRQLTRTATDADGIDRGFGLDDSHPDVARLAGIVAGIAKLEHDATLNLQRQMRMHPLGQWVKAQSGIGEKQAARLLAAIGDPYWNTLHNRPRTVSELWAYCGLHVLHAAGPLTPDAQADAAGGVESDLRPPSPSAPIPMVGTTGVAARRRKGQRTNWSNTAKMRAYLIATSCMKVRSSPFRADYDTRRKNTAVTHPEWTAGHSHNDALRITAKAILREMWRESKRITDTTRPPDFRPDAERSPGGIR